MTPEYSPPIPTAENNQAALPSLARLSILWLASNLFWSVIMSQVLAQRVEHFAGDDKGRYIALIGACGAIISTLVQLVVGPISDNFSHPRGRRYPFVVGGVLLSIIPIFAFAFSQSFLQLLAAFIFIQLFLNIAIGPFQAIIPDRVPASHHGKAASWMGLWQLVGQVFGLILPGLFLTPSIINFLTHQNLPDAQAISLGVILSLSFCVAVMLGCLLLNAPLLQQPPLPKSGVLSWKSALRDAFDINLKDHPDFAWLLASRFVINIGIASVVEFLLYYVKDVFHPPDPSIQTMWIALAATAGGVIGTLGAGRMADQISKRRVVYWSCGFAALAGVGFCVTDSIMAARVIGFVFGVGYGAFCAVDWAFAANLIPKNREGKFMAIFHIAFTVPQALSFVFGIIGQRFGYRAIYAMVPFFLLAGAFLISKVRERHEIESEEAL